MSTTASQISSARVESLRAKHRELDQKVRELSDQWGVDEQTIQDLKKRKLQLKDEIARLEGSL
jgi:hypothetical protein